MRQEFVCIPQAAISPTRLRKQLKQLMKRIHLSLRAKLLAAPLLMAVVFGGSALALNLSLRQQANASRSADQADEAIAQGNQLSTLILDMETGMRGYRLTGELLFLRPYTSGRSAFDGQMRSTRILVRDNPEQMQRLDMVNAIIQNWLTDVGEPSIRSVVTNQPVDVARQEQGKTLIDQSRNQLDQFIATEQNLKEGRSARAQAAADRGTLLSIAAIVLALLLGLLASLWALHSILRPVSKLAQAAKALGRRSVDAPLPPATPDEIGDLVNAFGEMRDDLLAYNRQIQSELAERARAEAEREQFLQREKTARAEAEALTEINRRFSSSLDLDQVLQAIVESTQRLVNADMSHIKLLDANGDLRSAAIVGNRTQVFTDRVLPAGVGLGGRALATGQPCQSDDYLADTIVVRDQGAERAVTEEGIVSGLAVPITRGAEIEGVLIVSSRARRHFTPSEVALLERLSAQAATALANAQAYAREQAARGELAERTRALEAKTAEQDAFIYTVSHDLKAPLVSIQGMAELLAQMQRRG